MNEEIINWKKIEKDLSFEEKLFELSRTVLKKFAEQNLDKTFYGLIFDCEPYSGKVWLSLNTEDDLAEYAIKKSSNIDEARWNPGDWTYHSINYREMTNEEWLTVSENIIDAIDQIVEQESDDDFDEWYERLEEEELVDEYEDEEEFQESFLVSVCRVALKIKDEGLLDYIHKTRDFKVLVYNHGDDYETAFMRMKNFKSIFMRTVE